VLLGFLEREFAREEPPALGQFAIKQTLTLPPVRLAVESEFAVDLSAVLAEGPDALAV